MSFVDFIVDLLWGASEMYLDRAKGRDDDRRAGSYWSHPDSLSQREQKRLKPEQSDHDEVARTIGNKTV